MYSLRFTVTNSIIAHSIGGLPITTHRVVNGRFSRAGITCVGVRGSLFRAASCSMGLTSNVRLRFGSGKR